ncbi:TIGR03066 family protein [bacterium]|nr:TIGR03066 family protein [bacterium]
MTRVLCAAGFAAILVAAGGGAAGQEKDSPIDPAKLIGKWEPVEAKKDAASVVEFARGGKFVLKAGVGGKTETWEGTYTVTGQKLKISVKIGEKAVTEELVILKLGDNLLETEDSKGKKESLKRVGP